MYQLSNDYLVLARWLVCSCMMDLFDGPDDDQTLEEKEQMLDRISIEPSYIMRWLRGVRCGVENDAYTNEEVIPYEQHIR